MRKNCSREKVGDERKENEMEEDKVVVMEKKRRREKGDKTL